MLSLEEKQIIEEMQSELGRNIDREYQTRLRKRFSTSSFRCWGVRIPVVRKIANNTYNMLPSHEIDEVLKFAHELLNIGFYESKVIAFHWSFRCRRQFQPGHFGLFEHWLEQYVEDWSECDDFCTHTVGAFLYKYPQFVAQLKNWAESENLWMRRAAAVSLIYSLRRGQYIQTALEIAEAVLRDPEDLVQKGYGWMLKEASKAFPEEVFSFVLQQRQVMPRTALRYALEKFPKEQRQQALQRN